MYGISKHLETLRMYGRCTQKPLEYSERTVRVLLNRYKYSECTVSALRRRRDSDQIKNIIRVSIINTDKITIAVELNICLFYA
jgi:hypothetical protein